MSSAGIIFQPAPLEVGVDVGIAHRAIDAERLEAESGEDAAAAFPVGLMRAADHGALAAFGDGAQNLGVFDLDPVADDRVHVKEFPQHIAEIAPDVARELFPFRLALFGKAGGDIAQHAGMALARLRSQPRDQGAAEPGRRLERQGAKDEGEQPIAGVFQPVLQIKRIWKHVAATSDLTLRR